MILLAGVVVAGFGLFLVGLAVVAVVRPGRAARFLGLFASSARAHYTEQGLRLLAGSAMIVLAPAMRLPDVFTLFGWVLAVTAVGLLAIPWRRHHRFGRWAIPFAIRHLKWLALAAAALGAFVLYGVSGVRL